MIKKSLFLLCFLAGLNHCGNESTDYPGSNAANSATSVTPVSYKVRTLIFYQAPYSSEIFYHFIYMANFNKIESSYFQLFNLESPLDKSRLKDFWAQMDKTTKINMILFHTNPEDVPDFDKNISNVGKIIFLFPKELPKIDTATNPTVTTTTFPANYNYVHNTVSTRYSMQDKVFLLEVLKKLTGGDLNKPILDNMDDIAYVQGISNPMTPFRVLQGDSIRNMKEKITISSLSDGFIAGIPIDPQYNTQIQINSDKIQTIYWLKNLSSSFLFFELYPILTDELSISSFFEPLNLSDIFISGLPMIIDKENKNKAIYTLHVIADPSVDSKQHQWVGDYSQGILTLKVSPNSLPIACKVQDDMWNIFAHQSVKIFDKVRELKKDYLSKKSSSGSVTITIDDGEEQKTEESPPMEIVHPNQETKNVLDSDKILTKKESDSNTVAE